jgi:hypothetical protein
MRLNKMFRFWLKDEDGLVLVFSALALPIILLLGVLVLQSGQLYERQAQLKFVARQAASSGLVPLAQKLQTQAELNYQAQCEVEFPPSICSASHWTAFLSASEAESLANQASMVAVVETAIREFVVTADPRAKLEPSAVEIIFPVSNGVADKIQARVELVEVQVSWLGHVLRPEDYAIKVDALSYLKLQP